MTSIYRHFINQLSIFLISLWQHLALFLLQNTKYIVWKYFGRLVIWYFFFTGFNFLKCTRNETVFKLLFTVEIMWKVLHFKSHFPPHWTQKCTLEWNIILVYNNSKIIFFCGRILIWWYLSIALLLLTFWFLFNQMDNRIKY